VGGVPSLAAAGHTPLQVIALCIAIAAKRLPTRDLLRQIIRGKPQHTWLLTEMSRKGDRGQDGHGCRTAAARP
jgi:hypothetical protein